MECQHQTSDTKVDSQSVDSIVEHAEQHCKAHGARLTTKRKQVLSILLATKRALSAYELVDLCKQELGESIPAMSVYRILQFLEDESLVHKLSLANKYVACAHITCDHSHAISQFLICGKCNKVEEISIPKQMIEELKDNIKKAGYHLISPQLEMNCVCSSCST